MKCVWVGIGRWPPFLGRRGRSCVIGTFLCRSRPVHEQPCRVAGGEGPAGDSARCIWKETGCCFQCCASPLVTVISKALKSRMVSLNSASCYLGALKAGGLILPLFKSMGILPFTQWKYVWMLVSEAEHTWGCCGSCYFCRCSEKCCFSWSQRPASASTAVVPRTPCLWGQHIFPAMISQGSGPAEFLPLW